MGAERIAAVADAGPLIHLYEIDHLDLLRLFSAVHIPDLVWREATGSGRVPEAVLQGLTCCIRHPETASQEPEDSLSSQLHGGERAALHLCAELGVPLLLTDDLAAREVAQQRGVTPVGSVGIVAKSYLIGNITLAEAESALGRLYDTSTLFVSRAIVEQAMSILRQSGRNALPPDGKG